MKKYTHDFTVSSNLKINDDYFVINLKCPVALPAIEPGQFAEVLVPHSPETYLRRPLSIYSVNPDTNELSLLVKKIGKGTRMLAEVKPGEQINLVYPLGNWFGMPAGPKALLIGGGVGIAPMLMLARKLRKNGYQPDVLIGGRSAGDIVEPEKYEPYGRVFITTDDGSAGEKGMVTGHSVLRDHAQEYSVFYACGPDPMMKAIGRLAESLNIPCEISLENTMACGMGACLCCVVETTEGNKTTCIEGPVFNTLKLKH
jgi:dihydroorotate dehydrogenase electron transfer subunit